MGALGIVVAGGSVGDQPGHRGRRSHRRPAALGSARTTFAGRAGGAVGLRSMPRGLLGSARPARRADGSAGALLVLAAACSSSPARDGPSRRGGRSSPSPPHRHRATANPRRRSKSTRSSGCWGGRGGGKEPRELWAHGVFVVVGGVSCILQPGVCRAWPSPHRCPRGRRSCRRG